MVCLDVKAAAAYNKAPLSAGVATTSEDLLYMGKI